MSALPLIAVEHCTAVLEPSWGRGQRRAWDIECLHANEGPVDQTSGIAQRAGV